MKLFRKHSISILNKSWVPIKQGVKFKFIPRSGELIFIEEQNRYFKVLTVVYYVNNKQGIFIIVDDYGDVIEK